MSNIEVVLSSAANNINNIGPPNIQQQQHPSPNIQQQQHVSNKAILRLSWTEIVAEFDRRYDEVFLLRNAKAHFDFCVQVIDGAKERWRQCLLLDAILSIYCQCLPQDHRSVRRQFEHHDVFKACVQFVFDAQNLRDFRRLKYDDPALSESNTIPHPIQADEVEDLATLATERLQIIPPVNLMSRTEAIRVQKINFNESNIILKAIEPPWTTIHLLKNSLLADDRIKKGFLKRKRIVEELCDLQILQENGLFKILNNTVCFILAEFQGPFKFRESILTRCIRQNVEPKPVNQYSKTYNNIHNKDKGGDSFRETYRNSYKEALKDVNSNDDENLGDTVSSNSSDSNEQEFNKKDSATGKRRGRGPGKKNIVKKLGEESIKDTNPDDEKEDESEFIRDRNSKTHLDKLKILLDVVSTYPPRQTKRKRDEEMAQSDNKNEDGEQQHVPQQSVELEMSRSPHNLSQSEENLARQYQYQKMMMQNHPRITGHHPGLYQGMPPQGISQSMNQGMPGMPAQGMQAQGMQAQGMPGMQHQGMQAQVMQHQGMQAQGMPGMQAQGMPGMQAQGMPGMQAQGMPGMQAQGMPGMQAQGMPGMQAQGMPGMQAQGMLGMQAQVMQAQVMQHQGMQGMQAQGMQAQGMQAQEMQHQGMQHQGMSQSMNQGMQPQPQGMQPQGMSQQPYMGYSYPPYMYPPMMRPSMPFNGMAGFSASMGVHNMLQQQKTTRFSIRPGTQPGPWCAPGCLVGMYDDGLGHPTVYAHLLVVVSASNTTNDTNFELTVTLHDEITLLNVESTSLDGFKAGDKNEILCLSPQGKVTIWDRVCPQSRAFGIALRHKTLFSESGDLLPDETDGIIGVRAFIDNQIASTMVPNMIHTSNNQSRNPVADNMPPQMYGMPPQTSGNWRQI